MSMILDLVFPKFCLGCAIEGTYLCHSCQNKIITIKYQTCPACQVITRRGAWCTKHQFTLNTSDVDQDTSDVEKKKKPNRALSGIMTLGYYHDPILREAIHLVKYRRIDELIKTLANLASTHFSPLIPHSKVMLIPVPLHPWRQRQRDFNQAALLASHLVSCWSLTYLPQQLIRVKSTRPQADLPDRQRLDNVKDGFGWQGNPQLITNKTIWLIDDVATTGATLEECAKVLKQNGAKSIWGVVLAKG